MEWNYTIISGKYCPRQFEYHPQREDFVFGTISGEVCSIDTKLKTICSLGHYGVPNNNTDTILGICWLKDGSNKFVTGSSHGRICLGDVDKCDKGRKAVDKYLHPSIVKDYPIFDRLTSLHINCTNQTMLASGYSKSAVLYDMETGAITREYKNVHTDHINISRFANHSPNLFATSSFDGSVKTWDMRMPSYNSSNNDTTSAVSPSLDTGYRPIYTIKCNSGVVMINFSNDDAFILASALDNEINQYLFVDGRKHLTYDVPKTGQSGNFTRAYYSSSGRHVVTGSCEESSVRVMSTHTGEVVTTAEIYPGKKDKSLYIQSLRGSPIDERSMCVLTNYRDLQTRELVLVTLRDSRSDHAVPYEDRVGMDVMSGVSAESASPVPPQQDDSVAADAFASFYLPEYSNSLLNLRRYVREMTRYVQVSRSEQVSDCDTPSCAQPVVHIRLSPQLEPAEMQIHKPNGRDIVFLVHSISGAENPPADSSISSDVSVFAVHGWLLAARCPALMAVCATHTSSSPLNESVPLGQFVVDLTLDGDSLSLPSSHVADITHHIPSECLHLIPLVIDYLYVGKMAVDVTVLRYCGLLSYVSALSASGAAQTVQSLLSSEVYRQLTLTHEGDVHSIMTAICTDDSYWRGSRRLSQLYLETAEHLLHLAVSLTLPALSQLVEGVLAQSVEIYTALRIYELSTTFKLNALCDCCVSYIAKHLDVLRVHHPQLRERDDQTGECCLRDTRNVYLLALVRKLKRDFACEVLSREGFRIRKHLLDSLQRESSSGKKGRKEASSPPPSSSSNNTGLDREAYIDISPERPENDDLWLYSESPHLEGSKHFDIPPSVCLAKFVGHHMVRVLDGIVLHIGGMNRERVHGLTRILAYNTHSDHFGYIYCEGTDVPHASNLTLTMALEKFRPRHVVVMGGKVNKCDKPVKYTFLDKSSMNMNITDNSTDHGAKAENTDEMSTSDSAPVTGLSFHSRPVSEDSLFFVLDCLTLTWSAPPVLMANEDDALIFTAERVPRVSVFWTGTQNPDQKAEQHKQLKTAMSKRAAQTIVPLHSEDVKYRCAECLFRDFLCERCNRGASKTSSPNTFDRHATTWLMQFGGYCTQQEMLCNDVHAMVCVDTTHVNSTDSSAQVDPADSSVHYSFRWVACETSGEPPAARFSHSSTIVPAGSVDEDQQLSGSVREHARMFVYGGIGHPHDLSDLSSLRICNNNGRADLHWEVINSVGPTPGRRHGHTMVHVPQQNVCVLFGGLCNDSVTHEESVQNDMWCLFLDGIHHNTPVGVHREFGLRVHWERISYEGGPAPSPRSRHSSAVTEDGVVLIFGGVNETLEGSEDAIIDSTSILQKQKDSLMYSLRLERKVSSKKQRVELVGQWLTNNQPSTFSHFAHEPAVCVSACSLNRDLLMLLSPVLQHTDAHLCELLTADMPKLSSQLQLLATSEVLTPDVTLVVSPPDSGMDMEATESDSIGVEATYFGVFGSLVATRSEWLRTILSSGMSEAQSRQVNLHDTDPHVFKLLLVYFYCDIVAYSNIDELYSLLVLANQYHIESLSRRGEGVLLRHLSEDNVCYLLEIADFLNLDLLKSVCVAQLLSSPHISSIVHESAKADSAVKASSDSFAVLTPAEVDCQTLVANFVGLREELRTEVLEFCRTADHVYKLSLQAVSTNKSEGNKRVAAEALQRLYTGLEAELGFINGKSC